MRRKTIAILLNAFVLPGSGHVYLGHKKLGVAIILVINLLLLLALFVLMKGLAPVIAAKLTSGQVGSNEITSTIRSISGYGKAVLSAFAIVWAFALISIIKMREE